MALYCEQDTFLTTQKPECLIVCIIIIMIITPMMTTTVMIKLLLLQPNAIGVDVAWNLSLVSSVAVDCMKCLTIAAESASEGLGKSSADERRFYSEYSCHQKR